VGKQEDKGNSEEYQRRQGREDQQDKAGPELSTAEPGGRKADAKGTARHTTLLHICKNIRHQVELFRKTAIAFFPCPVI
jgi:hypothetical protein